MERLYKNKIRIDENDRPHFISKGTTYYLDEYLRKNTVWNSSDKYCIHCGSENFPPLILDIEYGVDDYVVWEY